MNEYEKLGMAIEGMRDGMMVMSSKEHNGWIVIRTGQNQINVPKKFGVASLADAIREMTDR